MVIRITLDFQKITTKNPIENTIQIVTKIGEQTVVRTERAILRRGCYAFMERHTVSLQQKNLPYLQLTLLSQTNLPLSQITVFYNKFKSMNQIEMEGADKKIYKVSYSVGEDLQSTSFSQSQSKPKNKLEESIVKEHQKLLILNMGVVIYNFTQRLDPLVRMYLKVRHVVTWENPVLTLSIGLILTLVLLNLKVAILIGGIALYCYQNRLFQRLSHVHKYKTPANRLMAPEDNTILFQKMMKSYCDIYDSLSDFLFRHDKTILVNGVKIICKLAFLIILLLYFLRIEHITALVVWMVLLVKSPASKMVGGVIRPVFVTLVSQYDKVVERITRQLKGMLRSSRVKVVDNKSVRQFYLYHYERWVLFKGWKDDNPKFSNEQFSCEVKMPEGPPKGWEWISKWSVENNSEVDCDQDGYQYSNDFVGYFSSTLGIANRRRRKLHRKCVKINQ